jgi:hypothetical protein
MSPASGSAWQDDWQADFGPEVCYLWRTYSLREKRSEAKYNTRSTYFNVNFRWIVKGEQYFASLNDKDLVESLQEQGLMANELHLYLYTSGPGRLDKTDPYPTALSVNGIELKRIKVPEDHQDDRFINFIVAGREAQKLFDDFSAGKQIVFEVIRNTDETIYFDYMESPSVSFSVRSAQFQACISALN